MGKSYQRELNEFFQSVESEDFLLQKVTKGALTQARAKLSPEIFKNLSKIVNEGFYQGEHQAWGEYRVLAVDGSTIQLPHHQSVVKEFGEHGFGPNADSRKSLATISVLYDVLNCVTLDAQIDKYATSEAQLCGSHLEHLKEGDLCLFDRYYASFKLMWELQERKVAFCFRMKDNWFKEVEQFQKEDTKDKEVTFFYKKQPIKVRLIKIVTKDEGTQILCTSILDKSYDLQDFKELYNARWGIETNYRYLKLWLELENFSGKTALAVKQDFFAKIFMMNLCAALSYPIAEQIKKEKNGNYQVNRVDALSATKHLLIPVFYHNLKEKTLNSFDKIVGKSINKIKPGRSFERKKRPKVRFSMIYKNL
jgi:Transposase DDE domain